MKKHWETFPKILNMGCHENCPIFQWVKDHKAELRQKLKDYQEEKFERSKEYYKQHLISLLKGLLHEA